MAKGMAKVFITGGTGYMGERLIPELSRRGHDVLALVRPGSERRLPGACRAAPGNALDASSYAAHLAGRDTLIHLVGVPHPSPAKAQEFRTVDLVAARGAIAAATEARVEHFIYISVAQPAPVMKAYLEVRAECEEMLRKSGMNATILRPWYVLGPGHRWPYLLLPLYWVAEWLPATRDGARRLGLVNLRQMISSLVAAVDHVPQGIRILDVSAIRSAKAL
jgi:uncharacterized protein YbjT (DUF2867 family)